MTKEEVKSFIDEDEWYKEQGDTRIYPEPSGYYMMMMSICLVYPFIYDGTQMIK
jgi:hypothetical protein